MTKYFGVKLIEAMPQNCQDFVVPGAKNWYLFPEQAIKKLERIAKRYNEDADRIIWYLEKYIYETGCGNPFAIIFLNRDYPIHTRFQLIKGFLAVHDLSYHQMMAYASPNKSNIGVIMVFDAGSLEELNKRLPFLEIPENLIISNEKASHWVIFSNQIPQEWLRSGIRDLAFRQKRYKDIEQSNEDSCQQFDKDITEDDDNEISF